jgi:catechol 2,3-dioxygenase-like lactoylglutathione lyase family enzyme
VPPHGASGPGHACFLVPRGAYEAWRAFLPGRGIEVVHDHAWPGGGRSFYFHDPGGNVLEIADRDFWP